MQRGKGFFRATAKVPVQNRLAEASADGEQSLATSSDAGTQADALLRISESRSRGGRLAAAAAAVDAAAADLGPSDKLRAVAATKRADIEAKLALTERLWAQLKACKDDTQKAVQLEKEVLCKIGADGTNAQLWLLAAAAALRARRWDVAKGHLVSALALAAPELRLQAWWLLVDVSYARGDLAAAASALDAHLATFERWAAARDVPPAAAASVSREGTQEALRVELPSVATARELGAAMRRAEAARERGNAAQRAGRHVDAEAAYSEGLAETSVAAPPFAAKLFSNRAASLQAQGRWADALADALRACALEPGYQLASSRAAGIFETLRRPAAAEPLLAALAAGAGGEAGAAARARLMRAQTAQRRARSGDGPTPDHFSLLSLEPTATVRSRISALRMSRLHPRCAPHLGPCACAISDRAVCADKQRVTAHASASARSP